MALADPITVAASSPTPALSFGVAKREGYGSERVDPNGYVLTFNHSKNDQSGERHYMQIAQTVAAVNPYTGGTSKQVAKVSISASFPSFGWDATQKAALVKALLDTLADSDVTTAKFLTMDGS